MNFEIQVSGQGSRTTSLSILRNKVRKHALSKAHTQAVKVAEQQKEAAIENAVETMTESYMKETEAVFRTAYHLAKKNRPFSDHESLIELQELNEFICDLGLMYDTLHELSLLSQELQSRSITLLRAEHLLKRSIRVIQSFKESPGEKYSEALEAKQTGEYRSIALKTNAKLKSINPGQFLQSLVNNLEKRLSFEDETIMDLSILDQSKWPSKPSIRHGEEQVKRLCKRFNLCTDQALNGMRDLLEEPSNDKSHGLGRVIHVMEREGSVFGTLEECDNTHAYTLERAANSLLTKPAAQGKPIFILEVLLVGKIN
ncbi:unnamed protein product, partial [Coregonus sp. 'balchen']